MKQRAPARLSWLAGLLALYLIAPFAAGLDQLRLADWHAVDWPSLGAATAISLLSATLATILVALGGIPLGYLLARTNRPWTAPLGFAVQLPLALPPLSSGILLLFLLGYASPIGRLTQGALTDSFTGIVLAEAFVAAPFLIIAARSAFAGLDTVLEDVAATLGHRPWSIFLKVSLPQAWRSILAGMLLAWLRAFGEFGATVMIAYHPYSLPVYTYVAFGSQGLPAMLPVLLPTLLTAVAVMALSAAIRTSRRPPPQAVNPAPNPGIPATSNMVSPALAAPAPAFPPRALSFAFHRRLNGFDLDVAWRTRSSRLAILGASGSGKSMTLRLIAGLEPASDGSLILGEQDLSRRPPEHRSVAYVPQNYGLFPHLTAAGQVRFAVGADPACAHHWLDRLGLAGLAHRLPAELSLGQQQRVALARAFSRPADLLLLDEPFSALDAPLRSQLRREFRALQQDIGATTILVTHDPEEAFLLADELLLIDAGRVLQSGPVDTVLARPANEAAAKLLGADTIATGRVADAHHIDIGNGIRLQVAGPALPNGASVGWSVRPGSIRVTGEGDYQATICHAAPPVAGRRELHLHLGTNTLRATLDAGQPAEPGPCRVAIHPSAVQVWLADQEARPGCGRQSD